MAARDIRAGGAFVEFTLRKTALTKGLRAVSSELNRFGKQATAIGGTFAALGAAITTPFLAATKIFASVGDGLDKMAKRTGFSVEALSELGFAAEQSGTNITELESGIRSLQKNIRNLGQGLSTQRKAFNDLGISYSQIAGLSPEKQLALVSDALAEIENPAEKAALSMQLLGRAGQRLLPLLGGGSAAMNQLREDALRLGLTIDSGAAQSAAEFADTMNILQRVLKTVAFSLGSAIAPLLRDVARTSIEAAGGVRQWVEENEGLVRGTAKAGAGIAVLGGALLAVGGIAKIASLAFGAVATVLASPILTAVAAVGIGLGGLAVSLNGGRIAGLDLGKAMRDLAADLGLVQSATLDLERSGKRLESSLGREEQAWQALADSRRGSLQDQAQALRELIAAREQRLKDQSAQNSAISIAALVDGDPGGAGEQFAAQEQRVADLDALKVGLKLLQAELGKTETKIQDSLSFKGAGQSLGKVAEDITAILRDASARYLVERDGFEFELGQFIADDIDAQVGAVQRTSDLLKKQAERLGLLNKELVTAIDAATQREIGEIRGAGNKGLQDQIAELQVRLNSSGFDQQKKLIELQRQQRIRDAKQNGEDVGLINKLFDLQLKEARANFIDRNAATRGVTNSGALRSLAAATGIGKVEEKILKAATDQLDAMKDVRDILRGGAGVVTV